MDVFQWKKELETGISDVDKQHKHMVDITNQFGSLLSQNNVDFEQLEKIFDELVSYTQYHFKTEEELMAGNHLDDRHISLHKQEHEGFLQDVSSLHNDVISGKSSERNLFDFLLNWLVYHILGTDLSMGRQLQAVESGKAAEQAYLTEAQEVDQAADLLLTALDNLFSQVTQRNKELRDLNQTLEAKVSERTQELLQLNQQLEIQASTDMLTGLANRRRAMLLLELLWQKAQEKGLPLSCMLIDADHFKEINDTYGHDAGDAVLRGLAKELQGAVRTDDFVCRLGGDEFLIICPETGEEGVQHIAQQLHGKVAELKIAAGDGTWHGSISVGVATRNATMQSPEQLIKAADTAVYAAKKAGKNCVRVA
ncbi:diguanylate cyclase [Malonomonas rubra DSM 5091]|uniref:diguanylate cyclase n=1 Tax=Malonomonas rubra DSM 5091 TaxID=1122189 RepID=A0A1M6N0M0_MALRU|nr:GGDEF domain-containing protein [Malonomonas rubra]SHJ89156.1 diguanylate cyclase [Malonomonas rubra DSM 5091]